MIDDRLQRGTPIGRPDSRAGLVEGLWECCLEGSEGVVGLDGAVLEEIPARECSSRASWAQPVLVKSAVGVNYSRWR
jgi:hypothetical protein